MNTTTFAELRAQIEAKMDAIAEYAGTTTTTEAINQVCFVIAMLQEPDLVAQIRLGHTAEQTLEREQYIAFVAETFADEVEQHEQLSLSAVREFAERSGPAGFTEAGAKQYLSCAERVFRQGN